ncbi:rhomboid family intramembrane serine protease [Alicyclobacillus hesperidum subsp. aegles]|uniref:rhomboid family intramembrane serine protease n=1 Tax=Alicyclobacillus hesperidum TaxID=89784 RepID=UPI000B2EABE1|nr:rhomboid family intramembrane serine protease [Alicyclobacillus hesperidum]GLG01490.1 rhomboid family intramembrane serine protease [Alicyclobacillus hesperidum subsp. aegles]
MQFRLAGGDPVPAGWTFLVLNVAWYVLVESATGRSATGLLRAGAMLPPLVQQGQWFRILSAMFVHVSPLHILVNMISLWTLFIVERLLTTPFFIVLYVISGAIGNLLSMPFLPNAVSGGASGAIFGLFGAMLALALMGQFPPFVRNQLLIVLAVNVVIDISNLGTIGWIAHLGGMISGALLTLIFVRYVRNRRFWIGVSVVCCIATAVSLIYALVTPLPFGL